LNIGLDLEFRVAHRRSKPYVTGRGEHAAASRPAGAIRPRPQCLACGDGRERKKCDWTMSPVDIGITPDQIIGITARSRFGGMAERDPPS